MSSSSYLVVTPAAILTSSFQNCNCRQQLLAAGVVEGCAFRHHLSMVLVKLCSVDHFGAMFNVSRGSLGHSLALASFSRIELKAAGARATKSSMKSDSEPRNNHVSAALDNALNPQRTTAYSLLNNTSVIMAA